MRHYYFDTSAFARFYAVERGSVRVHAMVSGALKDPPTNRIVVSELIHPETTSALLQMSERPDAAKRALSRSALRSAFASLDEHLSRGSGLTIYGTTGLMLPAAQLVRKHRLRASDAVHLATALFAQSSVSSSEFYFVSCDRALSTAAATEGLAVLDPTV